MLPDGRIVMVETYTGKLVAWSAELGLHDYAVVRRRAERLRPRLGWSRLPHPERRHRRSLEGGGDVGTVDPAGWPDGRCETVASSSRRASTSRRPTTSRSGPTVGSTSPIPPTTTPTIRGPAGSSPSIPTAPASCSRSCPASFPNGIAVESDGSIVWVDSYGRGVYRRSARGRSEQICQLPDGHIPDGLKVDVEGNLWITAYSGGGVDVVRPDGTIVDFLDTGGCPLNCVFHDGAPVHHRSR